MELALVVFLRDLLINVFKKFLTLFYKMRYSKSKSKSK